MQEDTYLIEPKKIPRRRKLSANQQRVLELLLQGRSKAQAAREVGIHVSSVFRWLKRGSPFEEEYWLTRADIWETLQWRLRCLGTKAIDNMEQLLDSGDENIKLKATQFLLKIIALGSEEPRVVDVDTLPEQERENIGPKWDERYYGAEIYKEVEGEIIDHYNGVTRFRSCHKKHRKNEKKYKKLADGEPIDS